MVSIIRRRNLSKVAALGFMFFSVIIILSVHQDIILAEELKLIQLMKPQTEANPLTQLLAKRSSSRDFSSEPLTEQVLANLLWAAFGINRADSGRRTAPSASNRQEIDIYVAMARGLYLYDAKLNVMKPILAEDVRSVTGTQAFVKEAALNLIYVADFSKMGSLSDQDKNFYAGADTGFISENVYLYCTSVGLATVVRASIDRPVLAKVMQLRGDQRITLAQSVGYPRKNK